MSLFRIVLAVLLITVSQPLAAQSAPFSRGVNLSNWFQAGSPAEIDFERYTQRDLEQIRNLGCDVIRLPINLHNMTSGAPDYTLDPLFLNYLDEVVSWSEALELHLVLDNHTFDPAVETDPNIGEVLEKVWLQMAAYYRDRSELIYYEVLNEPHGISDSAWNDIQKEIVDVIRTVDTEHTIIIGPASWNSYANLDAMPVYDDDNLIYTFHFYDPFLFSHQGAGWGSPSMEELAGVPFPYRADDMPELPASLYGTWVADAYARYPEEGTVAKVQEALDVAIQFGLQRNVPLLAGEFGVLMDNAADADRVEWYRVVREYMEASGLAWTAWDYHGGFGVFEKGSQGAYEHDLNIPMLEALGLETPPQTEPVQNPDLAGFDVYLDGAADGMVSYGSGAGSFDPKSADRPWEGRQAIRWSDSNNYGSIGFDFQPDHDMQFLVERGYGLALAVRRDKPGAGIDVRFMDSNTTDPDDRPWRMGFTIDESHAPGDGNWHQVFVPLAEMQEQGAWEDGNWYNAEGLFDWSAVDRLEFAAGPNGLEGAVIGLDAIRLTALPPGEPRLSNDAGVNGLYYDPENSGHGFDFNLIDDGLVVYYYGHTSQGERLWLISGLYSGELDFTQPVELDFYELTQGSFGAPVEPATLWGSGTITLQDCISGSAVLTGADGQMDMAFVRLAGVPGQNCSSQ